MALITASPNRLTALELEWKLRDAGYDTDKLEELGKRLDVDLLEILAGWAPVLADIMATPKASWWRRLWAWTR